MRYTLYASGGLDWHDRTYYRVMAGGLFCGPRFPTKAAAHAWAQAQGWEPEP
jgi:hypothetical protein